jgi:hypothetical protein
MFAERMITMKENYIEEIKKLLPQTDIDMLDFIFQLLQQNVASSINPSASAINLPTV